MCMMNYHIYEDCISDYKLTANVNHYDYCKFYAFEFFYDQAKYIAEYVNNQCKNQTDFINNIVVKLFIIIYSTIHL